MMKKHTELLTPLERLTMIKVGVLLALNEKKNLQKTAAIGIGRVGGLSGDLITSTMLLAALTGIPVGVAWHFMDRKASDRRKSERGMQEKLKFYKNIATGMETRLATQTDPTKVLG